jgi:hypothetical protein
MKCRRLRLEGDKVKFKIVGLILICAALGLLSVTVSATGPVVTPACVISWDANIETDISGYAVYVSQVSGFYGIGKPVFAPAVRVTCKAAGANLDGQWYVTVRAFNAAGQKSDMAPEYPFFIQTPSEQPPPAPPTGLNVK